VVFSAKADCPGRLNLRISADMAQRQRSAASVQKKIKINEALAKVEKYDRLSFRA